VWDCPSSSRTGVWCAMSADISITPVVIRETRETLRMVVGRRPRFETSTEKTGVEAPTAGIMFASATLTTIRARSRMAPAYNVHTKSKLATSAA
jgi:hypothetical protein